MPLTDLSPRQHQVASLIADGLTNKQIGRSLNIVEGTIKCHVHDILFKWKLPTRAAIAAQVVLRSRKAEHVR